MSTISRLTPWNPAAQQAVGWGASWSSVERHDRSEPPGPWAELPNSAHPPFVSRPSCCLKEEGNSAALPCRSFS
jgi:hypothetical protein